ncbi:MAG TPA: glucosamine-6-phosphate deaminase [Candidatus Enterocloster faecavium]|uniref:Glucosamine-6-phosphate deaminase n=1 Tax=Candidatus Enterocloster faecavium TaxID=2838560 RepID=A0A9D2RLF8_9FIRM|nr:glucosamine-6-phosphate deaminase [Candidatus Enterocloster faecavium]
MKICETRDYRDMSRKGANVISAQMILKPDCVLGLATGSTPIGVYDQLVDWYGKGDLDFSQVKTVNLDEYRGLSEEHPQSYHYFMNRYLFSRVNMNPAHIYIPNGMEKNWEKECCRYEEVIRSLGGIDLQILGLGHNGHIGFNEPDFQFAPLTRCVDLTESTIEANCRFFSEKESVPRQAYTMGIKTIINARKILLLVSGSDKAEILRKVMAGPITPQVPASVLQLHPDVTVIADREALGKL